MAKRKPNTERQIRRKINETTETSASSERGPTMRAGLSGAELNEATRKAAERSSSGSKA